MLIELGVLDALVARFGGRADASELAVETMCNESLIGMCRCAGWLDVLVNIDNFSSPDASVDRALLL